MNKHTAELLEQHFDTAFAAPPVGQYYIGANKMTHLKRRRFA
jgi:hypothetical protein